MSSDKEKSGNNRSVGGKEEVNYDEHPELLLKHPLNSSWKLWYLEPDRLKPWAEMQNEITHFDSVEEFWSIYNHIKAPSELKCGCDYSLFKNGIRPMWEDDANIKGGRWVIMVNKMKRFDIDNLWLDTILMLIGETFKFADEINGAVVNIRKSVNKVSVWTSAGWNREICLTIGQQLFISIDSDIIKMDYYLHKDTIVHGVDRLKPLYTLNDICSSPQKFK